MNVESHSESVDERTARERPMTQTEAEDMYGVHRWGAGYFAVGPGGQLRVRPTKDEDVFVRLPRLVEQLAGEGIDTPLLLRFPQMIATQVKLLHHSFRRSIAEFDYDGRYHGVFPVKVNQKARFIQQLVESGETWQHGLEAGTKPEIALALASGMPAGSLLICNGYKDNAYVELALEGVTLGYNVVLIAEKLHELELILDVAERIGVRPVIGLRLKVHARGAGRWERSGGEGSKFGLNTAEILQAVATCRRRGWIDELKVLHFHIGSQITDIRRIKQGVQEAARFYAALKNDGVGIEYLDVGGGLGVDYDGSRTNSESSVNYTLVEYTNDVIFGVKDVCDRAGVPVPHIVSESGRAIAAYHSMLIFSVERQQTLGQEVEVPDVQESWAACVRHLVETQAEIGPKNYMECYHDALELSAEMHALFNLGRLSLAERAVGEATTSEIYRDVVYFARTSGRRVAEEIEQLEHEIAHKYVCNLSVFQSLPDSYAVGQLFPICPIHRLNERPTLWATIQDITCDSDGKIDKFGDVREDKDALRVHRLRGEPYHLGAFLTGAYQDVMGDFHNMLGEVQEATVIVTGEDEVEVSPESVRVGSCGEVLALFGYSADALRSGLEAGLAGGGQDSPQARERVLAALDRVLGDSPYLGEYAGVPGCVERLAEKDIPRSR